MSSVVRLSFSIDKPLYKRLDKLIQEGRIANRSEFIRDMIRERLVAQEWERNEEAVGTITLVFNHHTRGLTDRLTDIQHHRHHVVLASTHIHLDEDLCAEIVVVKGFAGEIQDLANELRKQKGVLHASLSVSSTGKHLA